MYYALDKIAYDGGETKAVHARFHGFKENATNIRPKGRVPKVMVNKHWMMKMENEQMVVNSAPLSFEWDSLVIEDAELDDEDAAALADWENEDED